MSTRLKETRRKPLVDVPAHAATHPILFPKLDSEEQALKLADALGRIERISHDAALPGACCTPTVRYLMDGIFPSKAPHSRWSSLLWERLLPNVADATHTFETEHFRIRYMRVGDAAVDVTTSHGDIFDPGTTTPVATLDPALGVPDYIQRVAYWLERAWHVYRSPPVDIPDPSPNAKIQVFVRPGANFYGGGIFLDAHMPDDLVAEVCAHEVFHVFQDVYQNASDMFADDSFYWSTMEGAADVAVDYVVDRRNAYIRRQVYEQGSLNSPGGGSMFAKRAPAGSGATYVGWPYHFALPLRYYTEQQSMLTHAGDEPTIGGDALRRVHEWGHAVGYNSLALNGACGSGFFPRQWNRFSYIGQDVSCGETVWGNFWLASFLKDTPAGAKDRRFTFLENGDGLPPMRCRPESLQPGGSVFSNWHLEPCAASPYLVTIDPTIDTVRIQHDLWTAGADIVFQVVLLDANSDVIDVHRTESPTSNYFLAMERDGRRVDRILAISATKETGATHVLTITDAAATPDVTVTSWNRAAGTHYEVDPYPYAWAWFSPDIWLDEGGLGHANGSVQPGQPNLVRVRLRNQGQRGAQDVSVRIEYQHSGIDLLSPLGWQPMLDATGAPIVLTGIALNAQALQLLDAEWMPPADLANQQVAVRVVVSCPDDPNAHDKVAFGLLVAPISPLRPIDIDRTLPIPFDPLWDPIRTRAIPRMHGDWELMPMSMRPMRATREDTRATYHMQLMQSHRNESTTRARSMRRSHGVRGPDPALHYPAHSATLPPGLETAPMLTVYGVSGDGHAMGATFLIKEPCKD